MHVTPLPEVARPTARYLQTLNDTIEDALATAQENRRAAHEKNKRAYDKRATVRRLVPGEQALVLMPMHANKMTAHWCGPYTVVRECTDNNYVLNIRGLHYRKYRLSLHLAKPLHCTTARLQDLTTQNNLDTSSHCSLF